MNTGEKIKYLRKQKGLTLEELGKLCGVGKSTVRKWETGAIPNMRCDKITKLARALDVSPLYLLDAEDQTQYTNTGVDIPAIESVTLAEITYLGTKIKTARKKAHLTQMELAKRTNLSRSYIGDIEKNRYNPSINTLKAIARATLTSVSELTDGQNIDVAQTRIPVVGSVRAGIPNDAIEDIIDYEEIAPEMAMRGKMFGLKIRGDSMEPRIKDGDVVIVLETPDVENGDLAVVLVNGNDATIKQISKTADALTLIPFNTSYTPIVYTAEQCKTLPVQIIGKVIELRAKF